MPRLITVACVFGVTSAALLVSGTSAADSDTVHLTYAAAEGCPEPQRFRLEVERRLTRTIRWQGEPPSQRIVVRIDAHASGMHATLDIAGADQRASFREFTTTTCEEAVVAVAVVAALAIDPNASLSAEEPLPPAPPVRAAEADTSSTIAALEPAQRLRTELGPLVAVVAGPASVPLMTAGVELSLRAERTTSQLLTPEGSIAALLGRTGTVGSSADRARFAWTVLRLNGCPLRLLDRRFGSVSACALVDVGRSVVSGQGDGITPDTRRPFWLSAGTSLRWHSALGPFYLTGAVGVLANVTRNRYVFAQPRALVYDTSLLSWTAQLGLGARL